MHFKRDGSNGFFSNGIKARNEKPVFLVAPSLARKREVGPSASLTSLRDSTYSALCCMVCTYYASNLNAPEEVMIAMIVLA